MGQRPVEIVLMRQLASYLAVPILIVDRQLDLVFFNESAEPILGRRFEETGEIHRGEWRQRFQLSDTNGIPIPPDEQPFALALDHGQPSHGRWGLTGLDGVPRVIDGIGFPLETHDAGLIGAAGIFWEVRDPAVAAPPATPARSRPGRSRYPVEVVLLRRLADRLTMPILVHDAEGRVLFYNPAAEPLLGRPFDELGEVELREWYDAFQPTDEDGSTIKLEDHPLHIARVLQQPSHRHLFFQGLDGVRHWIEGAAFPLLGQCHRHLGAVGIFWEGSR
jgi:PAS domain-containing protein